MDTLILKVDGMSCQHCVRSVKQALEGISGVEQATVNLAEKQVTISHDGTVDKETLVKAIDDAGYQVI